jgi:bacterioferritin
MKDAEALTERIMHLGGLPNLQRIGTFQVGENIPEQLRLSLALEQSAVEALGQAVVVCERENDPATGTMLRAMALEEDEHLAWVEAQLEQIHQIGEANYLTLQVRQ